MNNLLNLKSLLLLIFLSITLISIYFGYQIILLIGILGFFILGLIFRISIKQSLLGLIFIRPSLDILGNYGLGSINLAGIMALLSIYISIIIIYQNKRNLTDIPLTIPIFSFIIINFLLIFNNLDLTVGITEFIRILSFFLMYFSVFLVINSKEDIQIIIKTVIFSSIIPSIYALFEWGFGLGIYTNPGFDNRIAGTFGHPNVFGYFLLVIIALIMYVLLEFKLNKYDRVLIIFYNILLSTLLILTYTRGAWIGLFVLLLGIGFVKMPKMSTFLGLISVPVISLILFIYDWLQKSVLIGYPAINKIPVVNRLTGLFDGDPSDSILWRRQMWDDMVNKGLDSPIIGYGTGSVTTITEQVRGLKLGALEIHNDYIKVFVESGFVGLFFYGFMVISIIGFLIYNFRKTKNNYILVTLFISLAVYLSSIWDNILRQTAVMWIYFVVLAISFKLFQLDKKAKNELL